MSLTDTPLFRAVGRLPGHPSCQIDPARKLTFEFDGRTYSALAGEEMSSGSPHADNAAPSLYGGFMVKAGSKQSRTCHGTGLRNPKEP